MYKKEFVHPVWGMIKITVNNRARRIIMRSGEDGIRITVPPIATNGDIERALAKHGDRLKQLQTGDKKIIDTEYTVGNGNFRIAIEEYNGTEFMWVHNGATNTLMCPQGTEYGKKQEWLRKVIKNAIAEEAKRSLPARLATLAEEHDLRYSRGSVRDSHSRWGSCSGKGNISLCIYLVLLPDELIDYVILHELCHTLEMNHSERFWSKLDKLVGGSSRDIRRKLKNFFPGIQR